MRLGNVMAKYQQRQSKAKAKASAIANENGNRIMQQSSSANERK